MTDKNDRRDADDFDDDDDGSDLNDKQGKIEGGSDTLEQGKRGMTSSSTTCKREREF